MKEQGIVLSVNDHSAVIFTKTCQLIEIVAPPNISVGQEIVYSKDNSAHFDKPRIKTPLLVATMALAALFIGIFMSQSIFNNRTYAIISVDINPSVQFLLNKDLVITEVKAMNSDAAKLISEEVYRGLTWQNGVDQWFDVLENHGYESSERILVAAVLPNDDAELKYQLAALGESGYESEAMKAQVLVVYSDDFDLPEKAANSNLSIGMQILKNSSESSGIEWDPSVLKNADSQDWLLITEALERDYNVSVNPSRSSVTSNSNATQTSPQTTAPSNSNATQTSPQATAPSNSNATQTSPQATEPSNSNATQTSPQATEPSNSNATQTSPQATEPSNSNATQTTQKEIPSNPNATKNSNGNKG